MVYFIESFFRNINFLLRNMKVLPKLIRILDLFAAGDTLTFAEITARTNLTRSNTAHLLNALCQNNLLTKSSFGHYQIGPKLFELTGGGRQQNLLNMIAQRGADRVASELNELGVAAAFHCGNRITLAKVQPERMVQLSIADRWFEKSGWYCLSSGRLLLALQSDAVIESIVEKIGLPSAAEWPEAMTKAKLFEQIQAVRQQRYAIVMRENNRLTSLAVPVTDASGEDSVCISTVYITNQHAGSDRTVIEHLLDIAQDMHNLLCFHHISLQHINPNIKEENPQ